MYINFDLPTLIKHCSRKIPSFTDPQKVEIKHVAGIFPKIFLTVEET